MKRVVVIICVLLFFLFPLHINADDLIIDSSWTTLSGIHEAKYDITEYNIENSERIAVYPYKVVDNKMKVYFDDEFCETVLIEGFLIEKSDNKTILKISFLPVSKGQFGFMCYYGDEKLFHSRMNEIKSPDLKTKAIYYLKTITITSAKKIFYSPLKNPKMLENIIGVRIFDYSWINDKSTVACIALLSIIIIGCTIGISLIFCPLYMVNENHYKLSALSFLCGWFSRFCFFKDYYLSIEKENIVDIKILCNFFLATTVFMSISLCVELTQKKITFKELISYILSALGWSVSLTLFYYGVQTIFGMLCVTLFGVSIIAFTVLNLWLEIIPQYRRKNGIKTIVYFLITVISYLLFVIYMKSQSIYVVTDAAKHLWDVFIHNDDANIAIKYIANGGVFQLQRIEYFSSFKGIVTLIVINIVYIIVFGNSIKNIFDKANEYKNLGYYHDVVLYVILSMITLLVLLLLKFLSLISVNICVLGILTIVPIVIICIQEKQMVKSFLLSSMVVTVLIVVLIFAWKAIVWGMPIIIVWLSGTVINYFNQESYNTCSIRERDHDDHDHDHDRDEDNDHEDEEYVYDIDLGFYEYDSDDEIDETPEWIKRKQYVRDRRGNRHSVGTSGKRIRDNSGNWHDVEFLDDEAYIGDDGYYEDEDRLM